MPIVIALHELERMVFPPYLENGLRLPRHAALIENLDQKPAD
jgi:hypothetical protein